MRCAGFCTDACVHGCPRADHEDYPDLCENITCDECHYNTGLCSDCLFENTEACEKNLNRTS